MALSGTFTGKTDNDNIQPKIVWSATQSATGNYSTVTASLYYSRTNTGYTTKGTGSFTLTINGNKASASKYVTLTYNSNTLAITHKVQVSHEADGTKAITISATGKIPDTSLGSTTISSTVTLNTIPRATKPTLDKTSVDVGGSVTIGLSRASSSFTHDLAYKFAGSDWKSIATGVGTSYTWKVPDFTTSITDSASGVLTIQCTTKSGNTTIGTASVSLTINVPTGDNYGPKINSVSLTDATSGLATRFGVFISGKSKLNVVINAQGYGGSDIKTCVTTFLGATYKTTSFSTGVLSNKGTFNMVTTVTDSRGRTAKKTTAVTVREYYVPRVTKLEAYRMDSKQEPDPEGTYARISYAYNLPALKASGQFQGNTADVLLEYKPTTGAKWETLGEFTDLALDSFANTGALFSTDTQYDIRLTVEDYFGAKSTKTLTLPSGQPIIDIKANGKGIAFGKVAANDGVDFGWPILGATKMLWDGMTESLTQGRVMNKDQSVDLNEAISAQPAGAVFAWSRYNDTSGFHNWTFFFVPKHHVTAFPGTGVFMSDPYLGMRKYLYISDKKANGHANNDTSSSSNGVNYNSSEYSLRYVVGV